MHCNADVHKFNIENKFAFILNCLNKLLKASHKEARI